LEGWEVGRLGGWKTGNAGTSLSDTLQSCRVAVGLATVLSAGLYLGWSLVLYGRLAFPVDDAWIHQTLARNLVRYGQWAYNPGQLTTGSTAPLWTLLITPGHLLPGGVPLWTYGLGLLFMALTGWEVVRLLEGWGLGGWEVGRLGDWQVGKSGLPIMAGVLVVLEWHLPWMALSGMETTLFTFLALRLLERYLGDGSLLEVGLLGGLLILTRPEGVIPLGLVVAHALWEGRGSRVALRRALLIAGTAMVLVSPWLAFNLAVTGQPMPATFYAKHKEMVTRSGVLTVLENWVILGGISLISGGQLLLVPGLLLAAFTLARAFFLKARRKAALRFCLPLLWVPLHLLAYAWQLPVLSHHQRYYVPLFPVLILYGVWGTALGWGYLRRFPLLRRVYVALVGLVFLLMWVKGAQVYATDVRLIDGEWREVALWIRDHTAPQAVVAAHDIGFIGYFSRREVVDLAGLVTPEVHPFIGDEPRLLEFMREQGVDYVVTMRRWHPHLVDDPALTPVYRGNSPYVRAVLGENLVIYRTAWADVP